VVLPGTEGSFSCNRLAEDWYWPSFLHLVLWLGMRGAVLLLLPYAPMFTRAITLSLPWYVMYCLFFQHIPSCSFGSSFVIVCFVYFCLILYVMYSYCYVYVFLLLYMACSLYSVFIVPSGTLRLPWMRFFRAFSSVVRQIPGYNSQRRGTACTLPKLIVLFYVLFVCKCVLYYCHRVTTQLQLNISYHTEWRKKNACFWNE
jgi:hypothetical protein